MDNRPAAKKTHLSLPDGIFLRRSCHGGGAGCQPPAGPLFQLFPKLSDHYYRHDYDCHGSGQYLRRPGGGQAPQPGSSVPADFNCRHLDRADSGGWKIRDSGRFGPADFYSQHQLPHCRGLCRLHDHFCVSLFLRHRHPLSGEVHHQIPGGQRTHSRRPLTRWAVFWVHSCLPLSPFPRQKGPHLSRF